MGLGKRQSVWRVRPTKNQQDYTCWFFVVETGTIAGIPAGRPCPVTYSGILGGGALLLSPDEGLTTMVLG
jgi:hypothetical protein